MQVKAEYDQFIGVYPDIVTRDKCNLIISYFHELQSIGKSYSRRDAHPEDPVVSSKKKDMSVNVANLGYKKLDKTHDECLLTPYDPTYEFVKMELVECINDYINEYSETLVPSDRWQALYHKIQKTSPGEGYHVWHHEHSEFAPRRVLAYTLYLNDVDEGGETEFLWQHKRVPAKAGTLNIFPAQFTHPHRGNPPLSTDKYIMTGWVEAV